MLLHPLVAHAGQTEEEDTEQLGVKQGREQSGRTMEVGKYPVHYTERSAHLVQPSVTKPIDVYRHKQKLMARIKSVTLARPLKSSSFCIIVNFKIRLLFYTLLYYNLRLRFFFFFLRP